MRDSREYSEWVVQKATEVARGLRGYAPNTNMLQTVGDIVEEDRRLNEKANEIKSQEPDDIITLDQFTP